MNVLVTGANGQLGSEIQNNTHRISNYYFSDADSLDITDAQAICAFVQQHAIDLIVNCAAYTNVDKAEDDCATAEAINHTAVAHLASVCKEFQLPLIHISTDYVFGGTKNTPYRETDATQPLGVYGRTKLAGEQAIQNSGIEHLIIRTSWLYSLRFGNNFVKTIQRLSGERPQLKVVADQVGTPTNAADLADFIVQAIENAWYRGKREVYHFSNEGVCSWYDFAVAIVAASGNVCEVLPCTSAEFPSKVTRPSYSVLDKTKLKTDFGYRIPYWRDSFLK
ncbi:dTDP-4-dehydrorhamnose reductase [Capnocytophaga sputigena]|uniref:dTDP-4-dehydrorhamnose reductase n=1 Tax=Capnocytophaga sputigena TaxID=1019 RepID=UPI0028F00A86|nr:dTDP-4-dehydrorhamnose reductase [Capnocytophaga sputigena]